MKNQKTAPHKNLVVVLLASLIPGACEIWFGSRKKGLGFLFIFAVIASVILLSPSYLSKIISVFLYLSIALPAGLEQYQMARFGRKTVDTSARWYVTFLLLTNGFAALPLLWQSDRMTRAEKILWSVAVPLLAVFYFTFLIVYWNRLESAIRGLWT